VTGQLNGAAVLVSGKERRYTLNVRLGGPQRRSGHCGRQ